MMIETHYRNRIVGTYIISDLQKKKPIRANHNISLKIIEQI